MKRLVPLNVSIKLVYNTEVFQATQCKNEMVRQWDNNKTIVNKWSIKVSKADKSSKQKF